MKNALNRSSFFLMLLLPMFLLSGCHQFVFRPGATADRHEISTPKNNLSASGSDEIVDSNVSVAELGPPQPAENKPPYDLNPPVPPVALVIPQAPEKPKTFSEAPAPTQEPKPPQPGEPAAAGSVVDDPVEKQPIEPAAGVETAELKEPAKGKSPLTSKSIQSFLDEALDFCQAAQDFWQKGELENALEALDQAYSLVLKTDGPDMAPELIQQKEDLRLIISRRILEIYASRYIVAHGTHNAIPLVVNKYVQTEINLFTTGRERNFFINSYKRSGRYRDYMVSELRKAGLPEELSWLPLIESGFKANALSSARALGLWQFIPSTGFKFGLSRDFFIDERMDFEKSTQAAIAYLRELHQIFGDWMTALAAYNCGEGRVLRVIRSQNVNYLDDFWDLFERLPFETARYVPRFLATLHVINNKERYGLDEVEVDPPFEFETTVVNKQMHLRDIAETVGINKNLLSDLNPELRHKMLPHERYQLRVPVGKAEKLLAKLDEIPASSRTQQGTVSHRVRAGESLSIIARRYGTSVSSIVRANNIKQQNFIVAGQVLTVPQSRSYQPAAKVVVSEKPPATHTVRSGDSLWIIAKRYGTTIREIQELNKLNSTMLNIGQILRIPGHVTEPQPKKEMRTYLVKGGDSPYKIAQQFKIPLEQFLRINQLTPRSTIYPGQKLYVE